MIRKDIRWQYLAVWECRLGWAVQKEGYFDVIKDFFLIVVWLRGGEYYFIGFNHQ